MNIRRTASRTAIFAAAILASVGAIVSTPAAATGVTHSGGAGIVAFFAWGEVYTFSLTGVTHSGGAG